jgi:hypothetical protein
MNFWKKLSRIGVSEQMDFRLARRVILSNQFAFTIALLSVGFLAAFGGRSNFNFIPFLAMVFIATAICVCNYSGLTKLARLLTSLTPAAGLLFVNMSVKFGAPSTIDILHYATPRMLILGSSVLPFAMFMPAEKTYMWTSIVVILSLAFGYDAIHSIAHIDYQSLGLKNNFYGVIYEDMVVLALMILLSSGFMFNLGNQYDMKTQKLLSDALQQTEQLKRSEEEMRKTMKELESSRKKDDERNWVSKGLADMISILQSTEDMSKVFDKILISLVKYSGMNQGALFIVEENEDGESVLRMVSCYAYERKKYIDKTVAPGVGLIGQTYLEGERVYLTQVPADFVRITSGLGEAPPRHVSIIPVKTNKNVEGIFELASFHPMDARHFELFERIAETVAAFISTNRVNEKTKVLLQKAQVMSEELKSNEEEMRQNLEELTATQEAMERKEREYRNRIAELEQLVAEKTPSMN